MDISIAYEPIADLFRNAVADGRHFLYEYEVYNLLSLSGSETPPQCNLIPRNSRIADDEIMAMPGETAVRRPAARTAAVRFRSWLSPPCPGRSAATPRRGAR